MKQKTYQDVWPSKIDFDYLENLEVEFYPAKILYKSFFSVLNLPKLISSSLIQILSSLTVRKNVNYKSSIKMIEQQFFRIFDEVYSLEKDYKIEKKIDYSNNNDLIGKRLNLKINGSNFFI